MGAETVDLDTSDVVEQVSARIEKALSQQQLAIEACMADIVKKTLSQHQSSLELLEASMANMVTKALSQQQINLEGSMADVCTKVLRERPSSKASSPRECSPSKDGTSNDGSINDRSPSHRSHERSHESLPEMRKTKSLGSAGAAIEQGKLSIPGKRGSRRSCDPVISSELYGRPADDSPTHSPRHRRPSVVSQISSAVWTHDSKSTTTVHGLEAGMARALLSHLQPVASSERRASGQAYGAREVVPSGDSPSHSTRSSRVVEEEEDEDLDFPRNISFPDADGFPEFSFNSEESALAARGVHPIASDGAASCNFSQLRSQRTTELVEMAANPSTGRWSKAGVGHISLEESESTWSLAMFVLQICGIIPWPERVDRPLWRQHPAWYQFLVLLLGLLSFLSCMRPFKQASESVCQLQECLDDGMLSDIALSLGSFVCLVVTLYNSRELSEFYQLMHSYSEGEEFDKTWSTWTHRDLAATLLLWLVAVLERIRSSGVLSATGNDDAWVTVRFLVFSFSSLILLALAFSMLYVCRGLIGTVDAFCQATVGRNTFDLAVQQWNIVQALLRQASTIIQWGMIMMHATVLCTILLGCVDVHLNIQAEDGNVAKVIPMTVVLCGISMLFVTAAAVTDKCKRVPSLVNSCIFEDDMSSERQYIVEFILNSAAGFYIFEVRLTSDMLLKFAYLCVVVMFALATKILSGQ